MKKLKIFISVLAFFLLLSAAVFLFFGKDIISLIAEGQLRRVFPGSTVSIGKCEFRPSGSIIFSDIEIARGGLYTLRIKKSGARYSVPSVFAGNVEKIQAQGFSLNSDLRKANATALKNLVNISGKSVFRIHELSLSGAALKIKTPGLDFDGTLSFTFLPGEQKAEIDAGINNMKAYGISLEGGRIAGPLTGEGAEVFFKRVFYNDASINDIQGKARLDGYTLLLNPLSARLFDGIIKGGVKAAFSENGVFSIALNASDINLASFVEDFKLGNKFQLTGELNGSIDVKGKRPVITGIQGSFSTDPAGGVLIIKDTGFLENMAKESGQSLDILMENFKEYLYTIGSMKVSLEDRNLLLDISMEGDAGKRDFNIILHDFVK